jgi:MFS family permease
MKNLKRILPIIVISQFCCTSLWFAGNAVLNNLIASFTLNTTALENLTSAVQLGFITGTLLFALFALADRFSPSKVFFVCALLGALCNACLIFEFNTLSTLLIIRFLTGFFLAGIYPIGMKIATDYYKKGLGTSLGFLVGALVLGTALPHLLKEIMHAFSWKTIVLSISGLATFGGCLLLLFVPNGPYLKKGVGLDLFICFKIFKNTPFRKAAFGYFGHMWEVYTFWAFVPLFLKTYSELYTCIQFNIPLLSFCIIGIGGISCVLGSYLAERYGTKKIASLILFLSCVFCFVSPFFFLLESKTLFVLFLLFWGMVVIADSPLFSTLVAQNAPEKDKGTALTIVNCIGFSITILSIQLISILFQSTSSTFVFLLLAIGPILGLISLSRSFKTKKTSNKQL